MILVKYATTTLLIIFLTAARATTSVTAESTHPAHNSASCYWRVHPRTHETSNVPAAFTEAQRSLWLATQESCGPAPFIQSVDRWSRLLISP